MADNKLLYIDLFAGCGGLSLGLQQSGLWKGIFAIEKNPDAFKTLEYNLIFKSKHFNWPAWLPQTPHDIDDVISNYSEQIKSLRGKVDLVAGGPPCQGFSTAGLRREGDVRNGLVRSYLKFIMLARPKTIFFENVKGFTLAFKENKTKGEVYSNYVVRVLNWLGYDLEWKMINFANYGIPQKRTRFILVGVLKSNSHQASTKSFFKELRQNKRQFLISRNLTLKNSLSQAISDLLSVNGAVPSPDSVGFKSGVYGKAKTKYQIYLRRNIFSEVPDSHRFVNHRASTVKKFKFILENAPKNKSLNNQLKKKIKTKKNTTYRLDGSRPSPTLTTLPDDYIHFKEPRVLTVREYARIQSFPDCYEFQGKYTTGGKLRTIEVPRYSQIGNAIPPLFAEQAGQILKSLTCNG